MNEVKNYHLTTVGCFGLFLTAASYGTGIWTLATGSALTGAILMAAATSTLMVALSAFGRIRRNRPDWSEYSKEVKA